jgi:HEAT repeat protein
MPKNIKTNLEIELAATSVRSADERVETLLADLRAENPDTRARAARGLGNIGGARVIDALIEALGDNDAKAYEAAKEGVLLLRPSSIPAIVQALERPNSLVRAGALELIGEMHLNSALEQVQALVADSTPEVRVVAADVLIRLEGEQAIDVVAPLVEDVDGMVRLGLVKALGRIQGAKSAGLLAPRIHDYDPAVRRATVEALAQMGDQNSVDALRGLEDDPDEQIASLARSALQAIGERAVGPYLDDLTSREINRRLKAFDALIKQGKAAVQPLLAMLDNRNPTARLTVIRIIGSIGDELALPALIQALTDANRENRIAALESLGRIKSRRAMDAILDVFGGDDADLIDIATRSLVGIGSPATEALLGFLRSDNPDLRVRAAQILGQIKDQQALTYLISALGDEGHWVRAAAAISLGELLDPSAAEPLMGCLQDEHPSVRAAAAAALGQLRDLRAAGELLKVLNDEQDSVRAAAVRALGRVGVGSNIEALMKMLDDPSAEVRIAAIEAMGYLRIANAAEKLHHFARLYQPPRIRRAAHQALEELRKSREEEVDKMKAQVETSQSSKVTYS